LERIYLVAGPSKPGEVPLLSLALSFSCSNRLAVVKDSVELIEKREQNTKQKRLLLYELLNKPADDGK